MAENNAVVRVYDPHAEVEATIKELQSSGFNINKLSIVGKDYHIAEGVISYDNADDRMKVWCQFGDFWGGLSGLLLGSAFYFIPRSRHSVWTAGQLDCQGAGGCRDGRRVECVGCRAPQHRHFQEQHHPV
jgi:hypothetical protein